MLEQTKLQSLIETVFNTFIGLGVALASQLLIFPLMGINVPLSTNLWLVTWFTIISVIRGYIVRRWFNARLKAVAQHLAERGEARAQN